MNILNLIAANLQQGPETVRFPESVAPLRGYRGLVQIDTTRCVACGVCAYVCPSTAITVSARIDHCDWSYDPGRCTFCGRCADLCLGDALSMEETPAPAYTTPGALARLHTVPYPACPECGKPARPINREILAHILPGITEEVEVRSRLCERCRLRRSQRAVARGISAG